MLERVLVFIFLMFKWKSRILILIYISTGFIIRVCFFYRALCNFQLGDKI